MESTTQTPQTRKRSFSMVFIIFLLAIFLFQAGWAFILVWNNVIPALEGIQQTAQESTLTTRVNALEERLRSRLKLLDSYLTIPIFTNAVLHPEQSRANLVDTMNQLEFLESGVCATLTDFTGKPIYITGFGCLDDFSNAPWLTEILEGKRSYYLGIDENEHRTQTYWRIAKPIMLYGLPEGVLTASFPVDLNFLHGFEETFDTYQILLLKNGEPAVSVGSAGKSSITLTKPLTFEGLELQVKFSQDSILSTRNQMLINFTSIMLFGIGLIIILFHWIGLRLIVFPQDKLEKLTKDLNKRNSELEKTVKDLKETETLLTEKTNLLHESEKMLESVVEKQGELISRTDAAGVITFVNTAFCKFFHVTRESIIGSRFALPVHKDDQHIIDNAKKTLSPEKPMIQITHRVTLPSGETVRFSQSIRALYDADAIIGYQTVSRVKDTVFDEPMI